MFADEYGNRYQVKSRDSLTCCLMGRDDTCTNVNLYIEPHILYRGVRYRVVEIASEDAFKGDNRLQTLCLPHSLRRIGNCAFRECQQLIVADIPDEVTSMGSMVFWGCSRLTDVYNDVEEPQRVVRLFGTETARHIVLHVPAPSVDAYKKAECWNEVKCIVPTSGDDE